MGLFKRKRAEAKQTKSALEAAQAPVKEDGKVDATVNRVVKMILDTGLDGRGPLQSANEIADELLRETGSPEKAIKKIARRSTLRGGVGGFVTGLGGFVTMPIALPANVAEFYIQATRMVGVIAKLRGYDLSDERIRTAVLLTLVGSKSDDVLKKAGISTGGGRIASMALKNLPPAGLMVINKAIGFRLMRGVGEKALSRLGRGVPIAGGFVGGGLDAFMMKRIADQAMKEFPAVRPAPTS